MIQTDANEQKTALNADVVGYSRLMADDFEGTTERMESSRSTVRRVITEEGGDLINFVGDNFMALFDDVFAAMRSAISITTDLEKVNQELPAHRRLRFRMGLDSGEVAFADGEHFGEALNVAARIQAIAPEGGISISGRVYRSLDEPALRFHSVGRRALKNIPGEIEVFEFADLPKEQTVESRRGMSLGSPVLAVLPIHSGGPDQPPSPYASAVRSELIHRLARIPQLTVVDTRLEAGSASERPSARYLLESGVVEMGDQLRMYVQLMDVTTMNIVKAHRWAGRADEVFDMLPGFVDDVARDVEIDLIIGEPAGLYADLNDPEAIENVYWGWYHLTSDTKAGWSHAIERFKLVAKAHPDKPFGHVLTAFALWLGASSGWVADTDQALADALDLARLGLESGDPTGLAQMVQAAVFMSQGRGDEAVSALDGVEIIRPTCDVTYGLEGSVRRYLGEYQRAIELEDTAMGLTSVTKPWYPTVKACSLFMSGNDEQASAVAESVLEHQPNNLEALLVLAAAQSRMGLTRRAAATGESIRERFPSVDVDRWIDSNPYRDRELVAEWKRSLADAGVMRWPGR